MEGGYSPEHKSLLFFDFLCLLKSICVDICALYVGACACMDCDIQFLDEIVCNVNKDDMSILLDSVYVCLYVCARVCVCECVCVSVCVCVWGGV